LSPFAISDAIFMKPPSPQQLEKTLLLYRLTKRNCFSRKIISDIIQSAEYHIGIYGFLGLQLQRLRDNTIDPDPYDYLSLWQV